MRMPCLIRWPGQVPSGKVCDEVCTSLDFLPTLAALAGAERDSTRKIDGFDATDWANSSAADAGNVRSIGQCISGEASLAKGVKPVSEDANPIYQITAFRVDDPANATASAAVDTIFRP